VVELTSSLTCLIGWFYGTFHLTLMMPLDKALLYGTCGLFAGLSGG
jgi:hypothetical protein